MRQGKAGRRSCLDMHPCGYQRMEHVRQAQVLEGQRRAVIHEEDQPREFLLVCKCCCQARELWNVFGAQQHRHHHCHFCGVLPTLIPSTVEQRRTLVVHDAYPGPSGHHIPHCRCCRVRTVGCQDLGYRVRS